MIRSLFTIIIILTVFDAAAICQSVKISGRVFDKEDTKILSSGTVIIEPGNHSTIINSSGEYNFFCKPGRKMFKTLVMGYETEIINITVDRDTIVDFYLKPKPFNLNEIIVTADSVKSIEISDHGNYFIASVALRETPKFFSEPDLLKSLQLLPGILSGKEGSSEIFVRGGNAGQNVAVANGCFFFLPSHLLGFISPFDIDFLESTELIKDYFPAEFGGGSSSVLKLEYKKSASNSIKYQVRTGLLSSGITADIPWKNINSIITAGLRIGNYPIYAALLRKIDRQGVGQYLPSNKYSFLDGYLRFIHTSEKAGEINFLFIGNYDNGPQEIKNESIDSTSVYLTLQGVKNGWNSMVHALRWIPSVKGNHTLWLDLNYNRLSMHRELYQISEKTINGTPIDFYKFSNSFSPGINNIGSSFILKGNLGKINYSTGFSNRLRFYSPSVIAKYEGIDTLFKNEISEKNVIDEPALFFSSTINIKNSILIDAGIRFSGSIIKNAGFFLLEPRLRVALNTDGRVSPHVNFITISQSDHNLEGTYTGLRSTLWLPISENFGPEKSNVFSAGIKGHIDNNFIFTLDAYFKKTSGMAEFKPGASYIYDESFDDVIDKINGRAYGIETGFIRRKGRLTGSASYTYSRSKREWKATEGIKWIPSSADRPHNFNISLKYSLNSKNYFGLNCVFISGSPATIYKHSTGFEEWFESKNNIRYLDYHRMDLSYRRTVIKRRCIILIDVDVNNVYNRKNTFYFAESYDNVTNSRYFKNISLFPIMPSVAITLKF